MRLGQRLADLDGRVFARWPSLAADTPRSRVQLLVVHQASAMAALLAGIILHSDGIAALALGFIMLTIGGLVRMLPPKDDVQQTE